VPMLSVESIALVLFVTFALGVAIYFLLADRIKTVQSRLETVSTSVKQWTDWLRTSDTANLRQEFSTQFQKFGEDIVTQIGSLKRLSSEETEKIRQDIVRLAEQRSIEAAVNHIKEITITKEEFERLRQMVVKLGGKEDEVERIELLAKVLDTSDIKALTWQCKLIHLLEGGLAPETEEDSILASGIPLGAGKKLLKSLEELQIAITKKVQAYWLADKYSWFTAYTREPEWLKERLESLIAKEFEYQKFIRNNLDRIEQGLVVISEQYELPSGKVDIFSRDIKGQDVCIELKYPVATSSVVGQLLKYREDQKARASGTVPRCVLVCPTIPEKLRENLQRHSMEWRELSMDDGALRSGHEPIIAPTLLISSGISNARNLVSATSSGSE